MEVTLTEVRTDGSVSRGHASEPKGREFESHSCHLVRAHGCRYVQVRPVRPKINHLKKQNNINTGKITCIK